MYLSADELSILHADTCFLDCSLEKGVELDSQWIEFGDVRYHIQVLELIYICIYVEVV